MNKAGENVHETLQAFELSYDGIENIVQGLVVKLDEIDESNRMFSAYATRTSESGYYNDSYEANVLRRISRLRSEISLTTAVLDQAIPYSDGHSWIEDVIERYISAKEVAERSALSKGWLNTLLHRD